MLEKLIKHEFKATSRFLIPLYLLLLVLSILDRIVLTLDIFHGTLGIIPAFITFFYIVSIIVVVIVTFVIMIMRFYKNLMTDEGYLMFTLPVKSHQLINSKLIISVLWTIFSILAVIASLLIVLGTPDRMQLFGDGLRQMYDELHVAFGGNSTLLIIEFIVMILIGLVQNILMIYVSIAVGQLFNGHRVLGSFAAYIGISTAVQIFITVLMVIGGFLLRNTLAELESIPQIVFPFSIIVAALFNVVYYMATNYIFKKKLNLE